MTLTDAEATERATYEPHRVGDVWVSPNTGEEYSVSKLSTLVPGHAWVENPALREGCWVGKPASLLREGWTRLPREDEVTAEEAPPAEARTPTTIPDLPAQCDRGHRAYKGLLRIECPTCEAIRAAEVAEPSEQVWSSIEGPKGVRQYPRNRRERVWRVGQNHKHPTRDGAIALWRAAKVALLDAAGRQ